MKPLCLLLLAMAGCAAAQTTDGITAPVSRTVTLTADEAAFTLTITASLDSTVQQVKQALQNAGLPNPTVVATGLTQDATKGSVGPARLLYSATVTLAAGSAIDTVKGIEALRAQLPAPLASLQYSVAFNPSQATVEAARLAALPQMMDDARKLAQSLAGASGVKVGAIRSIGDSASGTVGAVLGLSRVGIGNIVVYDPVTTLPFYSSPSSMQYTFYLSVVFATSQ